MVQFIVKNFYLKNVKVNVKGDIPKGAAIIVANHDNPGDPSLITVVSKRVVHFFTSNLLFRNALHRFFLNLIGQIPVQSGLRDLNERAFSRASYYLNKGELVGIFPYPDDMVRKKKVLYSGVIKLIRENNVSIIPINVKVNEKRKWKSFFDVNFDEARIIIGKPIKGFRKKCKKGVSKKYYLDLTKELMKHINNLKC